MTNYELRHDTSLQFILQKFSGIETYWHSNLIPGGGHVGT